MEQRENWGVEWNADACCGSLKVLEEMFKKNIATRILVTGNNDKMAKMYCQKFVQEISR